MSVIHHTNELNNKNPMIISMHEEKYFEKTQHPLMIKAIQTVGIGGAYIIKAIYENLGIWNCKPSA